MKETKLPIKSMADLKRERRRLKAEIAEHELFLKEDIAAFKESLKPINAVSKFVSKFVSSGGDHTMMNRWVDTAVTFALRNVVLSRAGWITKMVVPILARKYANNKLEENKVDIVETVRGWLHKLRDKRSKEQTNGYYDRTTADINL